MTSRQEGIRQQVDEARARAAANFQIIHRNNSNTRPFTPRPDSRYHFHTDTTSTAEHHLPSTRVGHLRVKIRPRTANEQQDNYGYERSSSLRIESPINSRYQEDDDYDDDGLDDDEDFFTPPRQSRKRARDHSLQDFIVGDDEGDDEELVKRPRIGERQSARTTRHKGGMQEKTIDDIFRSDEDEVQPARPRAVGAREIFQPIAVDSDFVARHISSCESCGNGQRMSPLVYCQGCSLAYHHECLGPRSSRLHVVTKIGESNFVLQCRRCVGASQKKNNLAPHDGICQACSEHSPACQPFRVRKTALQEQKERDENDGVDPITEVNMKLINNADNVLFRCTSCFRAWHVDHLPPRGGNGLDAKQILHQYTRNWTCNECNDMTDKISTIIAWRPSDHSSYDEALSFELVCEDEKEYLIKFENMSYFRTTWVAGAWLWSKTTASQRKAFVKRPEVQQPKMSAQEAIPEDYLHIDVVLTVRYSPSWRTIADVAEVFAKYKGLPYEEACWEQAPTLDMPEYWSDFKLAYDDWQLGLNIRSSQPNSIHQLKQSLQRSSFQKLQARPDLLSGGVLMDHQLEGLNWLLYNWVNSKNAILGDEMGLGKTIQVIAFLATLLERLDCFPSLIVVPNSTCPNWRREIKKWAPGLKVVTYYGTKASRDLVSQYELFPNGGRAMKCHVVVTSYEAAAEQDFRDVFRGIKWQALVVDEGQRLKNDKTNLYGTLQALNVPFKVLLTGTPLQNNQRELFNLLQFLDKNLNAAKLEDQYQVLDQQKITELHDMIRPHFLRRTKRQVLTFLPPMQQVWLPVSMSLVQRKVYKTILTKNAELMRTLLSGQKMKKSDCTSLSNILMQLRKCLCHPFVYSQDIEERTPNELVAYRNLIDASNKLKLLEIMLPILQADGHRVLFFSQFLESLNIIEDFLTGMGMSYQRLDGNINSLEKQKRIDRYNAPGSPDFAFLLSTRAGGVGINLATADTVIILDPDFNPHQDLQALSRAHRIGQTKKVLCFRLVTVGSAEERIMSIGNKKLALEKALIQHMDIAEESREDTLSAIQHGVKELFSDAADKDIVYDEANVRKLLDRSQISADTLDTHDTDWSHAEVWKTDDASEDQKLDLGAWEKILADRERLAKKATQSKVLGRGRRKKDQVDYTGLEIFQDVEGLNDTFDVDKLPGQDQSDQDFDEQSDAAESDDERSTKSKKAEGGKAYSTPTKLEKRQPPVIIDLVTPTKPLLHSSLPIRSQSSCTLAWTSP